MFQDSPKDITDGTIEIVQTFQSNYNSVNIFIGGILPCDASWSINWVLIKDVNKILKVKCSQSFFISISYDSCWPVANCSLNPDLLFLHNVHLVEKGNLKLAESIFSSIKNCNHVTCNKHKQFLKSCKINNFVFLPLSFSLYLNLISQFLLLYHLPLYVGLPVMLVLFPWNLSLILPTSVTLPFVQVMSIQVNLFVQVNLCV